VTSPIVSTVNLNNAKSIITGVNLYDGTTFKQPPDVKDKQGTVIPQRNNVMVTTGVVMPGFDASLRAFLVYKPHVDSSQPTGYKFKSDGTRIWVACAPGQTGCAVADPNLRNLFTADASGTLIPFTTSNTATLASLMNLNAVDASNVIAQVRALGLGAVIDSTPGFLNPPSLDPPPDDAYPGFAATNKDRRTLIWAGTNRGILEAIDARTGLEVWGFIPLNLLPKLRTLLDGQSVGKFDYFMDGSPKLSDVRLTGICDDDHKSECWRTHMIVGEGPGGTFYQSFDVTMDNLAGCIAPDNDNVTTLLGCFNSTSLIKLNWAFPSYTKFDKTVGTYGDVSASATAIEKTVGQTWSDPAVGQVLSTAGPYSVLLGSGFLPYSTQQQSNRGGIVAGTTFYIVDAKTGAVYATSDVGSDGLNEVNTVANPTSADDCTTAAVGCKYLKNALQTDPVATGPSDSRFITKAYLGDLDGNVWRFDIGLSGTSPIISTKNKLFSAGSNQPIFSSMATVNVGGSSQYVFFGTGSDLLPAVSDNNTQYHLLGVLDTGAATGAGSLDIPLTKANNLSTDERVTAFPAVAGDIVFFTTTTFKTSSICSAPDAKLYGLTFKGGPAYDTNNDGKFTNSDSTVVKTIAGQRATAPFIVDQHLVFGTQGQVSVFGDPEDFNNGVGQAGVRILSWREIR
jgi:Tfp pilus tip-associated adhesin PilY1